MLLLPIAPAKPVGFVPSVKSKSRTAEDAVREKLPVPAVILNEMLLASVTAAGVIVLAVALELVRIISGVPVTVMVVTPVKIVPVLFSEIVFVPKANVPVKPVQVRV